MVPEPANGLAGVDHCILGVDNLEAARTRYESLGFTVTPRGRHIGWATANYCIMFPLSYIELLGILDPGGYSAGLDTVLAQQGEGLLKLAMRSDDAERTHTFLREAGLVSDPVRDLARELEMPDGVVLPEFRLIHPLPEATPGLPAFVCQHLTPEIVWRDEWLRHRNTAIAVDSYSIAADDPQALAAGWGRLLGPASVTQGADRIAVETGTARLDFVSTDSLGEDLAELGIKAPEAGRIAGACILVRDLSAAAACLAESGLSCIRTDDALTVPPGDACGLVLSFASGT